MKAIEQIAGHVDKVKTTLDNNERIDVFDGAAALGRNLNGGTLPAALTEIQMAPTEWTLYNAPCVVEPGGGVILQVPGVYLGDVRIRYPTGAGNATVTLGLSFGLPVYTLIGTAAVTATSQDFWQSVHHMRYIPAGSVVRLCAVASAPIAWQWAFIGIALVGMVD